MKSYDDLKAEIEGIQQQTIENKKNKRANALKEIKSICKEFRFASRMIKGSLSRGHDAK